MKRLVFKLGDAHEHASIRVLQYVLDGFEDEIVVPASAREIMMDVAEGSTIEDAYFYDRADDGSESRHVHVFRKYVVSERPPLLGGSCLFDKVSSIATPELPEVKTEVMDALEKLDPVQLNDAEESKDEASESSETKQPEVDKEESTVGTITEEIKSQPEPEAKAGEASTDSEVSEEDAKPVSEAEHIRNYLRDNPDADNKAVIAALGEQGIEVNSTQVSRARKQVAS